MGLGYSGSGPGGMVGRVSVDGGGISPCVHGVILGESEWEVGAEPWIMAA